ARLERAAAPDGFEAHQLALGGVEIAGEEMRPGRRGADRRMLVAMAGRELARPAHDGREQTLPVHLLRGRVHEACRGRAVAGGECGVHGLERETVTRRPARRGAMQTRELARLTPAELDLQEAGEERVVATPAAL